MRARRCIQRKWRNPWLNRAPGSVSSGSEMRARCRNRLPDSNGWGYPESGAASLLRHLVIGPLQAPSMRPRPMLGCSISSCASTGTSWCSMPMHRAGRLSVVWPTGMKTPPARCCSCTYLTITRSCFGARCPARLAYRTSSDGCSSATQARWARSSGGSYRAWIC